MVVGILQIIILQNHVAAVWVYKTHAGKVDALYCRVDAFKLFYQAFLTEDFSEYPLWFRDLLKEPSIPNSSEWGFWQYSNRRRLRGVDKKQKYVDLNVFNGDMEKFMNYIK